MKTKAVAKKAPNSTAATAQSVKDDLRMFGNSVELVRKDGTRERIDPLHVKVVRSGRPSSGKQVVSIRLDPDVIDKFKATGPGWQARMNDVLKAAKV